mgnify:CR=1 FL=1
MAKVTQLPPPGKQGPLISEVAIERDPTTGAARQRWPMPVDSIPKALHGEKLLLQLVGDDRMFWVTPQGAITSAAPSNGAPIPSSRSVPCSRKTSDYTVCSARADLSTSHRYRILEFEAPCT